VRHFSRLVAALLLVAMSIGAGNSSLKAADTPSIPPSVAPPLVGAAPEALSVDWIEFRNTHTNETLKVVFRDANGAFIPEALAQLDRICGDHRSKEHRQMDPQLFALLADLAVSAGVEPRYDIISAFRSSGTNEKLRANGGGQAQNSQHIEGRAMDVRLQGVATDRLRDLARALKRGGVGYYPKSNFVHVDTARMRYWEG
jgi:uncharacterized protein YcbK (DUF882 family)